MATTMLLIPHKNTDLVQIYACYAIFDVLNVQDREIHNVLSVRMGIINGLIILSVRNIVLSGSILRLIWGILLVKLNVLIVISNV